MSWTRLSHLRDSGLTPGRSTKTLPATWLGRNGRKKKLQNQTDRTPNQMVKVKLNRQNHRKKHTHTHSQKEKKEKKKRASNPVKKSTNDKKH